MERQNKDELLNSLYAASSHAERCLSQLTDSLEESELLDLCAKFYTPLFENGRKVHAWIPDTVLPQLELELAGVDPELVTRLTESLNEFALLIIMIQLYSQLSEEMKNNDVFAQIISNFRALADQAVQEEAVLILLLILFRYAQTASCYRSLLYGDAVYYGVAVLLQFFGMKRSFDALNVFRMMEKRFISFVFVVRWA